MSLFSGMKLADSGSDRSTTDKSGPKEAHLKSDEPAASTEIENKSEMPQIGDLSSFSFMPGTSDGNDSPADEECSEDEYKMDNKGILSDKQLFRPDKAPRFAPSKSPDFSRSDDLNFDLDPVKVTGDVKTTGEKHRPAGFDLQDLDFSRPVDLDSETLTDEKQDSHQAAKSESSFSFITKEPPLCSDVNVLPADSQILLDVKPLRRQDVLKSKPVTSDDKLERNETTTRGDDVELESTLVERLQAYKEEYTKQLHIVKKSTSDMADQVCDLAKQCVVSGHDRVQKQRRLQELKQQQQQAVDVEDYETAEQLHLQRRALEDDMNNASTPLPCRHPALRSSLADLRSLCDQERADRLNMMRKYQELIVEQKQAVVDSRGRCLQWESGHLRKVQEERSKLDRDLGHLHLDKEHLHKREVHLADQIDKGTANLRQTRDSLIADRSNVQEEIKDLEAQLAALRLQEAAVSESIIRKDEEIAAVTRDFDAEKSAVEKEKLVLGVTETELRRKGEGLDEEEQKLAGRMKEVEAMKASETRLLADLEEKLAREEVAIGDLMDRDSLSKLWPEENLATLSESRENLLKKKDAVRQKADEVQSATSRLLQSQTRVVTLRQKVSDTEGHIAALKETKQLAVSGQNFPEAKRLADEIKKLTTDGQRIQEEMEELSKRNDERSKIVKMLREDVERLREEVDQEERRAELATKDKLLECITDLREQLETTSQAPLVQMLQRAELASSSLQVKFLCLKHQVPLPAELDEFIEDSLADEERTGGYLKMAQEGDKLMQDLSRDESLEKLRMEMEKLESQLQQAVEQEDYDTAELLQGHNDGIQQEIQKSGTDR